MSGWIKCSDRLPSRELDGVAIIVTIVTHGGRIVSETDSWVGGTFDFWKEKVTHWQPPPAPPKE